MVGDETEIPVEKAPEVFNVFFDRYVPEAQLVDHAPPPMKMKSIVVAADPVLRNSLPESSTVKEVSAMNVFPGPRPVLMRDLPKVLFFYQNPPFYSTFANLNLLDIDPCTVIPNFFDDFLILA